MSQPSIFQLTSWENYKHNIFIAIHEALLILLQEQNLPKIEDSPIQHSLNRHLAKVCFKKAIYLNRLPISRPTYNGENPPYKDDVERHLRENTKPDFAWSIIDHTADEENCERNFILECKRLGDQPSKNYVNKGIRRFIAQPHEYGKGDDSCGMIGYIQSMGFDDILQEINSAISQNSDPISSLPLPINGWQENGISELEHDLERPFPVSPFRMCHFWVDLRSNY